MAINNDNATNSDSDHCHWNSSSPAFRSSLFECPHCGHTELWIQLFRCFFECSYFPLTTSTHIYLNLRAKHLSNAAIVVNCVCEWKELITWIMQCSWHANHVIYMCAHCEQTFEVWLFEAIRRANDVKYTSGKYISRISLSLDCVVGSYVNVNCLMYDFDLKLHKCRPYFVLILFLVSIFLQLSDTRCQIA